jgi:tetratricopeptide (TPR) repeat protein
MADRFAYIPAIGIFVIVAWGGSGLAKKWCQGKTVLSAAAVVILILLMAATWVQVGIWRNSTTLFKHAIKVTDNNYMVHNNLGNIYFNRGLLGEAIKHYSESLRINPAFALAHNNLGAALFRNENIEKAIFHFRAATRLEPDYNDARNNLNKTRALKHYKSGNYHLTNGELDQARKQYQKALSIQPKYIPALNQLAEVYARNKNYEKALSLFSEVATLEPSKPDAYYNSACMFAKLNRVEESVDWLSKATKNGFNNWEFLKNDPRLDNIKNSGAYKDLVRTLQDSGK